MRLGFLGGIIVKLFLKIFFFLKRTAMYNPSTSQDWRNLAVQPGAEASWKAKFEAGQPWV